MTLLAGLVFAHANHGSLAAAVDRRGDSVQANAAQDFGRFQAQLSDGFYKLQQGQLDGAEQAFHGVLKQEPENAKALLGLAEIELKRGRVAEAELLLKRAAATAPDDPDVLVALGRLHSSKGRYQDALTLLRKLTERYPNSYSAFRDLGDVLLNGMNKPDDAIVAYLRAVELQPGAVAPRFGVAMAYLSKGLKGPALAQLEEASKLAPKDAVLQHMIGRIHASERRFPSALGAFDKALALQSDFVAVLIDRADVNSEVGNDKAAIADLERLVQIQPDNPTVRLKLGMIYHRNGRPEEARVAYLAALKRNGSLAVAYNNLATISLGRKEPPAQALQWATRAVELEPKVPQFQASLGWAHLASGNVSRAVAALETAARLGPEMPEIQVRMGEAYEAAGRKLDASSAYRRALASKAPFPQAELARARLAELAP